MDPEEIKRQKLAEMQQKIQNDPEAQAQMQQQLEEQRAQQEMQKQKIMRQILSEEARSRLARIKMAKPQFAEQVEYQLIQLAQSGRLPIPLDDNNFRVILDKIHESAKPKRSFSITRR
ncbi:DNA-binding protein [Methanococcus voltae]|jgi:programmed cell death protein 5|uniref:DNA-binding protein J3E07_001176 n=2 Tax=Methanococcus voltae TaxID=2188 RepID=A0A8J7UUW3_METVO|nr:DNA-binding protein [Methanococcus voltae]MBP2172839.1 programmed cell death protein 5 [Methanococcus voltae]MBP2201751.1 programmed cell death protein 5 [Methanococcus voltae]MCS3922539.1 programmed cell death protein 5 [Methanococcus voltae PS]